MTTKISLLLELADNYVWEAADLDDVPNVQMAMAFALVAIASALEKISARLEDM